MANYVNLKAAINAVIKQNGQGEITGEVMNQVLTAMVNSLGSNYQFAGVATPSTNPGTPDQNVFYMATQAGTYTNFSAIVLQAGISILLWNGSWSSETFFTIDAVPIAGSNNFVTSGGVQNELALGAVYDVSAKNPNAGINNDGKWESLSALLSDANLSTLIPTAYRKGGMSIKFIQSSDNKYVQCRYMGTDTTGTPNPFLDTANWQGVDDEPVAGSDNLVKSGGLYDATKYLQMCFYDIPFVGNGINAVNKSFKTEIGKTYRIYFSADWSIANTGVSSSQQVFIVRKYQNGSYVDVNPTKIVASDFNGKPLYIDYTATTEITDLWLRADSGNEFCLHVKNLSFFEKDAEIDKNTTDIAEISKFVATNETTLVTPTAGTGLNTGYVENTGVINTSETTYGYYAPILLKKYETLILNNGNNVYLSNELAVVYQCDSSGNFIKPLITNGNWQNKPVSYKNNSVEDIYVGISCYKTQLKYYISSFTKAAPNDVVDAVKNMLYVPIIGSCRYNHVTTYEKAANPVFLPNQEKLVGRIIVGIRVESYDDGTAVIIKCSNFRATNWSKTTLQTFNVKKGINYLIFDTPVKLAYGEAIGWDNTSTASYMRGGYDSSFNKGYYYVSGTSWTKSGADLLMSLLMDDALSLTEDNSARVQAGAGQFESIWQGNPFQAHLFIDKIGYESDVIIPSQSVFDIDIAHRLGFKVFELNVQLTSDGKAICMHGEGGNIGFELVKRSNGGYDINTAISSKTLAEMQEQYMYRSSVEKYKVSVTDLETALAELKKRGMIPMLSNTSNEYVLNMVKSYFGNMFIAYGGSRKYVGGGIPIAVYDDIYTKADVKNRCINMGAPYIQSFSHNAIMTIYKVNASTYSGIDMTGYTNTQLVEYFSGLTEQQKLELIELNKTYFKELFYEIHNLGCYVSWAPCYEYEGTNQLFLECGADCCAGSDKQVPDFDCGNLCNYSAMFDFTQFVHNGTVNNGVLTLTEGQTISVNGDTQLLAKGSLHIRFSGTLNVKVGHKDGQNVVSDGSKSMVFTSYYLNSIPTFLLTGVTETQITEIVWKASVC